MTGGVRRALEFATVFVAYVATARLGLTFDAVGGVATAVWPPSGIALAALTLRGRRLWPAVAAGAFVANVATGIPAWGAAFFAVGNTLEAIVGSSLLGRFGFDSRVGRLRDVLLLIGLAAMTSTMIGATFGLAGATAMGIGAGESSAGFWAVWWVGDAMGDLLVASLIFVWASPPTRLSLRPLRVLEAALLGAALLFVSMVVFRRQSTLRIVEVVRGTYVVVPLLIWAALRYEQRGVTCAMILVATVAITATGVPGSYFSAGTIHERLLMTDVYLAVTAISMMTLAAALAERRFAIGARDEFISIASHELKTPLTALKLRLSSAIRTQERAAPRDQASEEKLGRALVASSQTTDRLVSLVEDLLDVSRLTAGRLVLRFERVPLDDLVRDVTGRLREQANESGSAIDVSIPAPVLGSWDRTRIEQVVTNLLTNALKYGAGKPISLSAHAADGWARLQVKDLGQGISRADQTRIFQPFERVTSSTRVGGLGLGLYIGRQIAEVHGGTLTVESAPGQGATFTLDLPLEPPATTSPRRAS
jgi:signal transduction histidine kinase